MMNVGRSIVLRALFAKAVFPLKCHSHDVERLNVGLQVHA
jgi:hypothetical protein